MKAYLLSLNPEANLKAQWDFGFLSEFLTGNMWKTPDWQDFEIEEVTKIPKTERAIVAIAARHHVGLEAQINNQLKNIEHCVFFAMGDEERVFDLNQIEAAHIWVQNPRQGTDDHFNKIGTGFPPQKVKLANYQGEKSVDIFFSGQLTHQRRMKLWDILLTFQRHETDLNGTKGFTQGYTADEYYQRLARAKVAPAPSGPETPDSFRLFEALEAMAIPVADNTDPKGRFNNFWEWLFGEPVPFPCYTHFTDVPGYILDAIEQYQERVNIQTAWWLNYKRNFAYKVMEQLHA